MKKWYLQVEPEIGAIIALDLAILRLGISQGERAAS